MIEAFTLGPTLAGYSKHELEVVILNVDNWYRRRIIDVYFPWQVIAGGVGKLAHGMVDILVMRWYC